MRSLLLALSFVIPGVVQAQDLQSHCIALSEGEFRNIQFASYGEGLSREEVRLSYISHSTYLIETPTGRGIATDYTGYLGAEAPLPDVVTMNRAHSSHWTATPNPDIPHILRGWGDFGEPADHSLSLDDELLIRNVTTDIRAGLGGREENANSIFIFETAGLCIGHLGHLHHEPSDAQYALLGRLDVVMVPVDGGMTLPTAEMISVMERVKAQLVLPMHWFGDSTLQRFIAGLQDDFEIENDGESSTTVSLRTLPRTPTIRVLLPRAYRPANWD
ncbi:MBL fold metallo-hydrolase [Algicella marina]|uniref:Zn-dependent hydrolase n=1 Tax=Algicella marina TaxID=2683284 RepID=A0A6P1T2X3_9RHOB|nr:MBL fold metallo-hydrolase [Algicella marina]QHQ35659.1 Zn-dependent hydrolase [Algicella marina]